MERNYESEKKKRELVYPLDFKIIPENSLPMIKKMVLIKVLHVGPIESGHTESLGSQNSTLLNYFLSFITQA